MGNLLNLIGKQIPKNHIFQKRKIPGKKLGKNLGKKSSEKYLGKKTSEILNVQIKMLRKWKSNILRPFYHRKRCLLNHAFKSPKNIFSEFARFFCSEIS